MVANEGHGCSEKSLNKIQDTHRTPLPLRRGSMSVTSTLAATLGVTTRSRARAQQESQTARTELGEADGCGKRLKLDGTSQRVSPEKGKSILEHSSPAPAVSSPICSLSWGEDDDYDDDDDGSSAVSSPIRVPYKPEGRYEGDSELVRAYREFSQKLERQIRLPTLRKDTPPNCLVDDPTLLHIREPARKTVLRAAQFVVGISSSVDGEPLARCSGFWIDFDNESRTGTVVTTALLICTKHKDDAWFCKDQYASDAKVNVHLWGYIAAEGYLLYYQKHYNLAFFRVRVDPLVQLPSFSDKVKCAQDIFELGRDERCNLLINHGRVEYSNPSRDERYHHMYIQGQREYMHDYDMGGPVIDLDGNVVGMIGSSSRGSFIPSSILLKCFHLWRNFRSIPRPHLGLRFNAIGLLNPAHVEKILISCGIDEGLIVKELENMLLSIMENRGDDLNSDLDLEMQVYCTRRDLRRIKVLTVNVSEDGDYCMPCCVTRIPLFSANSYIKLPGKSRRSLDAALYQVSQVRWD
uniref:Uncharacterized protein n=1 Tax=Avena sativa TaxID=4498 RepID=A0ACD5W5H8_AVESA